jgi:hypothetical protein
VAGNQPVLHLSRHPISATHSLTRAYSQRGRPLTPTQALTAWVQGHRHCLRFSRELAQAPTMLLRSEDLLAEPELFLVRVCRHLGIDDSPRAIEAMLHPERSPYACIGPSQAPTGNDPNWMTSPELRRGASGCTQPSLQDLHDLVGVPVDLVMLAMQMGWQLGYT